MGLTVAFEDLAEHVTLVELDDQVAAVWKVLLSEDAAWLAERITSFDFAPETVEEELGRSTFTLQEKAFQTILKNRVNRGGILAPGAGRIKQGENGKGLASRWYPQTIRKRILDILAIRDRISFIEDDGMGLLEQFAASASSAFFIDPPYTAGGKKAGARLYAHSEVDHSALFASTARLAGDFLMSYDAAEDVRILAHTHGFDVEPVRMKNTHHAQLTELLIGRNLDWLRDR